MVFDVFLPLLALSETVSDVKTEAEETDDEEDAETGALTATSRTVSSAGRTACSFAISWQTYVRFEARFPLLSSRSSPCDGDGGWNRSETVTRTKVVDRWRMGNVLIRFYALIFFPLFFLIIILIF